MRRRFWLSRRCLHEVARSDGRGLCVFLCSRGYVSTRGDGGRQYVGEMEGVDWTRADDEGRPSVVVETTEAYEARASERVPSGGTSPVRGRQDADAVVEERQQREYEAVRQHRILSAASSAAYDEILRSLNDNLLVDPRNGTIATIDRQRIENDIASSVRRCLSDSARVSVEIDRSADLATTGTLSAQLRISDPAATLRLEVRQPDDEEVSIAADELRQRFNANGFLTSTQFRQAYGVPVATDAVNQPGQLVYATSDGTVTAAASSHLPVAGTVLSFDASTNRARVLLDGDGRIAVEMGVAATAQNVVDAVAESPARSFIEAGAALGQGLLRLGRAAAETPHRIVADVMAAPPIRGRHADLLVVDDLLDEAEQTPERQEQLRQVYAELSQFRAGSAVIAAPATATVRLTNTSTETYTIAPGVIAVSSAPGSPTMWVNSDTVTLPPGGVDVPVHSSSSEADASTPLSHIVRGVLPGVEVSQPITFETACGSDLDDMASTIYGLNRQDAEPDERLRQRCLDRWNVYCAREDATPPRTRRVDAVEVSPECSQWLPRLLPWLDSDVAEDDADLAKLTREAAEHPSGVVLVYVDERKALRVERKPKQHVIVQRGFLDRVVAMGRGRVRVLDGDVLLLVYEVLNGEASVIELGIAIERGLRIETEGDVEVSARWR